MCVAFPIRSYDGTLVAVNARAIETCDPGDRHRIRGQKSLGVFSHTALQADSVILVESAINAMSLATCGFTAAATIGTSVPRWLPQTLALKKVVIAYDADEGGNKGAERLVQVVRLTRGIIRLSPPVPYNDWNDALRGIRRGQLTAWLQAHLPRPMGTF